MALNVQVPERVSQCRCYFDNGRLACTGELTMPNFTRPTQDVTGAGIAGTVSSPTRGNLDSMQATFASRVLTGEMIACFAPGVHDLEFRAIIQGIGADSEAVQQRFSAFMRVIARGITSGTVNNNAEMGASAEFEVLDILVSIDDVKVVNVSKLNNIVEFLNKDGELVDDNAEASQWLGV